MNFLIPNLSTLMTGVISFVLAEEIQARWRKHCRRRDLPKTRTRTADLLAPHGIEIADLDYDNTSGYTVRLVQTHGDPDNPDEVTTSTVWELTDEHALDGFVRGVQSGSHFTPRP